jgi:hypothetical protein
MNFVTNKSLLNNLIADFAQSVFDFPTVSSIRFHPEKIIIKSRIPETSSKLKLSLFMKQMEDLANHLSQASRTWK